MADSLAHRRPLGATDARASATIGRVTDDATSNPPSEPATAPDPAARGRRRWLLWILGGVVALVIVVFGAIFVYANFINDAPDALDESDLAGALTADSTVPPPEVSAAPTVPATAPADGGTTPITTQPGDESFDGDWVPTDASEFGYRVEEVLAGVNTTAVGRGNDITGLMTIEGTTATSVDVEVLVESIESDSSLRDGQFHGRIMNVEEFPTATFRTTEPIDFGSIPTGDEQITATSTGELTLRGVTNLVTFEVTAQTTGGRIGVLGSIPVVFADYGIENPSFGQVRTEDEGLVEFVLVFERA
jgi:polyisoprenoid-binding protein YceI